jgi:acetoin utilization deacetylase AcuC-like enzyme
MRIFFDDAQFLHTPTQFMASGRIVSPVETPDRPQALITALQKLGFPRETPPDAGIAPILAVHADHYVAFLETAYERFRALPNAGPEVWPNVHPYVSAGADFTQRAKPRTTGVVGQAGWYVGDLACAMTAGTYRAIYGSAQSAIAAAGAVLSGDRAAFALCRPPGHHAYVDRASGFCFFNQAAIAAEILRGRYGRVAILDFDTHHGDGTQAIFYRRGDVFVGSTHTDPTNYYPFYVGYVDERGAGAGEGCNLNLPLPEGAGDEDFLAAIKELVRSVAAFGAEALVISAGWDAHAGDPLSRLKVTTDAYARAGTILGQAGLPSVILQEGGYSLAAVSEAAPAFLSAFAAAHG